MISYTEAWTLNVSLLELNTKVCLRLILQDLVSQAVLNKYSTLLFTMVVIEPRLEHILCVCGLLIFHFLVNPSHILCFSPRVSPRYVIFSCPLHTVRSLTDIADIEDRIDLEEVFHRVDKTTQLLSTPVNSTLNHTGEVHMRHEVPLRVVTVPPERHFAPHARLSSYKPKHSHTHTWQCCFGAFLTYDIIHRVHIGIETGAPTPAWFSSSAAGMIFL